jgi:hypothetical protein
MCSHLRSQMRKVNLDGTTSSNSGYAVRFRSPKPFATLRASHTRKPLGGIHPPLAFNQPLRPHSSFFDLFGDYKLTYQNEHKDCA